MGTLSLNVRGTDFLRGYRSGGSNPTRAAPMATAGPPYLRAPFEGLTQATAPATRSYASGMKLAEKGRYAPPPRLPVHAQAVSTEVASWPGVHARTHWLLGDETQVDGADFYVGERELGHIHLDGEVHLAAPQPLRDALLAARLVSPFRWSPAFVVYRVGSAAGAERARAIFRLAYDALQGEGSSALLARVRGLAAPQSESVPQ